MDHQSLAELLGNYGEFIGAIAVVATLIYLAIQVRQNALVTEAATSHSITRSRNELNLTLSANPELADLVLKGVADGSSLDPIERLRFTTYFTATFNTFEDIYIQHKTGFAREGQYDSNMSFVIDLLVQSESLQRWWQQNLGGWTPEFRDEVERMMRRVQQSE